MARIVLREPRGGLGDGLLYSTLPELLAGNEVVIQARPRNPEVKRLLYDDNPFVSRVVDIDDTEPPNAGSVHDREFFPEARHWTSPIALVEKLHGFLPKNTRPKIYYQPTLLSEWADKVVADPRSICQQFPPYTFNAFAERLFPRDEITVVDSIHSGTNGQGALSDCPQHRVSSIYEYCDIIASCRAFLVTESGGHSLAAAIREDGIYVACTNAHINSRFFVYPGVLYSVVDGLSPTYLAVDP